MLHLLLVSARLSFSGSFSPMVPHDVAPSTEAWDCGEPGHAAEVAGHILSRRRSWHHPGLLETAHSVTQWLDLVVTCHHRRAMKCPWPAAFWCSSGQDLCFRAQEDDSSALWVRDGLPGAGSRSCSTKGVGGGVRLPRACSGQVRVRQKHPLGPACVEPPRRVPSPASRPGRCVSGPRRWGLARREQRGSRSAASAQATQTCWLHPADRKERFLTF